jgi:hypothetical protein
MAADYLTTIGAFPPFSFPVEKSAHTVLFDIAQVFNHAHPEKSSVPFIELAKLMAGKVSTLIAILYPSAIEKLAIS